MFRISSGNRICSSEADLSRQSVVLNCLIHSAVVLRPNYYDYFRLLSKHMCYHNW
jgi:hypothetical protein